MWVYGDSVNVFFAQSLRQRKLCRGIFKECKFSYNWIYEVHNFTVAKMDNDNLDYNNERVLQSFRRVIQQPEMDEESAIILNFGLHFVESTNFTNFKNLVTGLLEVLQGGNDVTSNVTRPKYRGTVIWKTTTAINKEKASNIHLGHKRFMTQQVSANKQQSHKIIVGTLHIFYICAPFPYTMLKRGARFQEKNSISNIVKCRRDAYDVYFITVPTNMSEVEVD